MSCIVGFIDKITGDIYLSGDSAGVLADKFTCRIIPNQKVFIKENVAFGVSGSSRICQLLHYGFKIPEKPANMPDDEYMCIVFSKSLSEYLKENDAIQIYNEGEAVFDATFLVIYNGILYRIESDFSCFSVISYDVVGCGEDFAKAVLYAFEVGNVELEPLKKIEIAMSAACEFSIGVRPPFNYVMVKKTISEDPQSFLLSDS